MRYLKTYLLILGIILISTFINANLLYFDIISNNTALVLNTIVILTTVLCGGIVLGIKKDNGLKIGLLIAITFILLNLIFKNGFTLYKVLLYTSILITSYIGSLIGKKIKIKN